MLFGIEKLGVVGTIVSTINVRFWVNTRLPFPAVSLQVTPQTYFPSAIVVAVCPVD